jgi:hypothetical protein
MGEGAHLEFVVIRHQAPFLGAIALSLQTDKAVRFRVLSLLNTVTISLSLTLGAQIGAELTDLTAEERARSQMMRIWSISWVGAFDSVKTISPGQ